MDTLHQRALDILSELGSRPAAPFHEDGPAAYILETLTDLGLSPRRDEFGNVIAHYRTPGADDPPIAFVAHMDHPGFEIVESSDDGLIAVALGGVPESSLTRSADVLILLPDGSRVPARTAPHEERDGRKVRILTDLDIKIDPPAPGCVRPAGLHAGRGLHQMRAVDDLAGCAAGLAAMERLVADGARANAYAVFTRAEEAGLFGARLMAEAHTLPEETLVVSVESSPLIPGVEQGRGPVIRTGDALYTFDSEAEQVMIVARESLRERNPDFKTQRQLMSGECARGRRFRSGATERREWRSRSETTTTRRRTSETLSPA